MAEQFKLIHPIKYYRDYLDSEIRPDGRKFGAFRPIALNVGIIDSADGSAIVKIGKTNVMCGIRAEFAKPKPKTPENGYLVPTIELTAICSRKYRDNGLNINVKASEESDVLSFALYDILTNAECIDLKELCIHKEKLVWSIYCDVVVINHDGCILDAALISVISALRNLRLPKVKYDAEIDKISVDKNLMSKITVKSNPIATTIMVFDDNVIITDPTSQEEDLSSSIITIAVSNSDVRFIFKPGGTPFNQEQMDLCTNTALSREKSALKLIENAEENQ